MTDSSSHAPHVVLFGTADLGNARTRILLEGLERAGCTVSYCHRDIWAGGPDRSRPGKMALLRMGLRWLWAMLVLSARYLTLPKHDLVLVSYPGHADIWFARAVTLLRRKPLVWDAFISAFDTVVGDRKMVTAKSLMGRLAFVLDRIACRFSDLVLLDTGAHADYFARTFAVRREKVVDVPVGAEDNFHAFAHNAPAPGPRANFSVLFYGKFIPLHGISTILEASRLLAQVPDIHITLVGDGQMAGETADWIERNQPANLSWQRWVPYNELPGFIARFHVGLGIFSCGDKAGRVIPNKVYQMLACGLPVITRTSAPMEALAASGRDGIVTVPAGDAPALAAAIENMRRRWLEGEQPEVPEALHVGPTEVGRAARAALSGLMKQA